MKNKTNWYRCTTRKEMLFLLDAGFDYVNCRPEKHNGNNITYFFARNEKLDKFLKSVCDDNTEERNCV